MNLLFIEYVPIMVLLIVAVGLSLLIFGASFFFSIQKPDVEKISAYECGFDPYEDSRNKFEIRFYLVAILFLIFDLEAIFLFPWVVSLGQSGFLGFWSMSDFLLELSVGFFYVWKIGALDWE
jgi:NADH-quinone oxidoreductase subunit A